MADWEWRRVRRGGQKSVLTATTYPLLPTGYGDNYLYDQAKPVKSIEFIAENAPPLVSQQVEQNYDARKTPFEFTDSKGTEYSGFITQWEAVDIVGSDRETVTITMLVGTFE